MSRNMSHTATMPLSFVGSLSLAFGLLGACGGDSPMGGETGGGGAVCGNAEIEAEEMCDDGNTASDDGCSSTCQLEACDDEGMVPTEACDDADASGGDDPGACGDGVVQSGEACDDGEASAVCDEDCTLSACGDGEANAQAGEACDDGNMVDNDDCTNDCTLPVCGDGEVQGAEACDNEGSLCSGACMALCGDGLDVATCGVHLWSKRFGEGGEQLGLDVAVDAEGKVLVAGAFEEQLNVGGGDLFSQGDDDIFLAMLTPDGDHLWSLRFGDDAQQVIRALAVDGQGNVIVTGEFEGTMNLGGDDLTSQGLSDLFVAKFSPAGAHLWSKRFGDAEPQLGRAVEVDGQDNVVVTGNLWGTMNLGGAELVGHGSDLFVAKFSPVGAHLWSQSFGDEQNQFGDAVGVDAQDNVVIVGDFYGSMNLGGDVLTSAGLRDLFVAKFSPVGAHLWSRSFGDAEQQYSNSAAVDGADNVVLFGEYGGTMNLGGDDLASAGQRDLFAAKLAPTGEHLWSKSFGDATNQYGEGVATDGQGNVVLTGWFEGTMNLGGEDLVSKGATDAFVAKFTSSGAHLWSRSAGDFNYQVGHAVAVDGAGDVLIVGEFAGSMNLGGEDLVTHGIVDVFLAKLGS
jgi:cysteine-rich repeat protein